MFKNETAPFALPEVKRRPLYQETRAFDIIPVCGL
jgi:hypothetical protein